MPFALQKHLLLFLFVPFFLSCVNTRKATYFINMADSSVFQTPSVPDPNIEKNALLSITVTSPNPQATEIFNLPNTSEVQSSTQTGETQRQAGYLVGNDGNIRFPVLGLVRAEGLTKRQLQENIRNELVDRKLLLDPIVDIRHLNFKVTVLGEVTRPTVITVVNEKITLLEALGLAGDMTIYGKRNNVLVIREDSGRKVAQRVNLNSNELLTSPYYYLRSDDVVYVEPSKARVANATRLYQLLPIIISGISTSIFILDRIIK
jgi:polysaccharide export outer membrane protein